MLYQTTLREPVHAIGVAVHSGRKASLSLIPAPVGTGIRFARTDVAAAPDIPALASHVTDTERSTCLGIGDLRVDSVEHVLSALHGLGIDNLRIELSDDEVPTLDGSAGPFVQLIHGAGIARQDAPREFIRIKKKISVSRGEARATLKPFTGFKLSYTAVADQPESVELDLERVGYDEAVSWAGSDLDHGADDHAGLTSEDLRDDEFARHKLLDAIGDLYLLGKPLLGAFEGVQSGHALNCQLVRALLSRQDAWHLVTTTAPRVEAGSSSANTRFAMQA